MITTTAIGRLVRDPELRYTPTGTPLCRFRLACDRARGRHGTSYLDVIVWGAGAEPNAQHLRKGRQVAVTGSLDHQQWQTDDGNYHERYELNADHITWLATPRTDTDTPTDDGEPPVEPVTSDNAPAKRSARASTNGTKATASK